MDPIPARVGRDVRPQRACRFAQLPVHFQPVAFLAVWLELGLKRDAIDSAFDCRHATRGELRAGGLWHDEKGPGVGLLALGRPQEFRFETDRGFGHFAWYH